MNSRVYVGELMHARLQPIAHTFRYRVYFYAFDLNELPQLQDHVRGFSYNRRNVVALHDRDYLTDKPGSIRDKLLSLLDGRDYRDSIANVELVTGARFMNYVFNPVSFYFCTSSDGAPVCTVAEVNNTFGDKHIYLLDAPQSESGTYPLQYRQSKDFHVSPFNDMEGWYDFRFSRLEDHVSIEIELWREDQCWMVARLSGDGHPLSTRRMAATLCRYPATAAITMPRIVWQAALLHLRKRLPVYRRPRPSSPWTVRSRPVKKAAS